MSIKLGFLSGEESEEYINTHIETIQNVAEPFVEDELYDFSK